MISVSKALRLAVLGVALLVSVPSYAADNVDEIRTLAEQGDVWAQHTLGVMYNNGEGVNRDYVQAEKWIRKAAEQGDAEAQYKLGLIYYIGKGVTKDAIEAADWYRRAADQNHPKAQYMLGMMYHDGEVITRNDVDAAKWTRRAADQGVAGAQYNLGLMYHNGIGVTRDDVEAAKWMRRAADSGEANAQYNLGLMYRNGWGVPRNNAEGAKWIRKAADQGDKEAKRFLTKFFPEPNKQTASDAASFGKALGELIITFGKKSDEGAVVSQEKNTKLKDCRKNALENISECTVSPEPTGGQSASCCASRLAGANYGTYYCDTNSLFNYNSSLEELLQSICGK